MHICYGANRRFSFELTDDFEFLSLSETVPAAIIVVPDKSLESNRQAIARGEMSIRERSFPKNVELVVSTNSTCYYANV